MKVRRYCINMIGYSISNFILKLHSYINALTCSWYVSNTYHSPANVYVIATSCTCSTTVYWSRLGRNRYGTEAYLPSSYSRSEYLFLTRSVANSLVRSHQNHSNLECYIAVLRRPITVRFRNHSIHSIQQHWEKRCCKRISNRSGTI